MPPPQTTRQIPPHVQSQDTTHMLPRPSIATGGRLPLQGESLPGRRTRSRVGPVVGAVIVVALLVFGGLYFWGAQLNKDAAKSATPLIPVSE